MQLAIMIPMTEHHARPHVTEILRPSGWDLETERFEWPETDHDGVPLLPAQIAAVVQAHIENAIARGYPGLVIVTRSDIVPLRVRRMVAEGHPIDVTIHFSGSGLAPVKVLRNGDIDAWPDGLFSETFKEVCAIDRARRALETKP